MSATWTTPTTDVLKLVPTLISTIFCDKEWKCPDSTFIKYAGCPEQIWPIIKQIANALHYAHMNRIIHRDEE